MKKRKFLLFPNYWIHCSIYYIAEKYRGPRYSTDSRVKIDIKLFKTSPAITAVEVQQGPGEYLKEFCFPFSKVTFLWRFTGKLHVIHRTMWSPLAESLSCSLPMRWISEPLCFRASNSGCCQEGEHWPFAVSLSRMSRKTKVILKPAFTVNQNKRKICPVTCWLHKVQFVRYGWIH